MPRAWWRGCRWHPANRPLQWSRYPHRQSSRLRNDMAYRIHLSVDPRYRRKITDKRLREWASATLTALQQPDGTELELAVSGDDEIQELNRTYRGVNAPTDVLSFPYTEMAAPAPFYGDDVPEHDGMDGPFILPPDSGAILGELVISYPYAEHQAKTAGHAVTEELALLVVHGILHLVGHDHTEPDDQARMWAQTNAILSALGLTIRL
ncbi:MAG: rRNA maturation RNase YbeY [Dehalococcoidia bacterium]|nr:rRNA maturation RNase YbeY [Dehalococcoidia bacterium]